MTGLVTGGEWSVRLNAAINAEVDDLMDIAAEHGPNAWAATFTNLHQTGRATR